MASQNQNPSNTSPPPSQQQQGAGEELAMMEMAMREDYVQNAVKFLSHPKVRGSPVQYRRSFLQKKGLTDDEIDEAFRRVPDPQPTATTTTTSHQANNPNQSTGMQPYTSPQPMQPATGPVTSGPIIASTQPRFSWYRALVAAGLLLGFGTSAAVFVKKLLLPRVKSWIHKVVAEEDETAGNQIRSKINEETAEAVKASASAVSAIVKTNQELLASKDEEKKILVTLTQALDSQAKELKSLIDSVNNRREPDRFPQYRPLEEHVPSATWNGPVHTPWRASQQTNMYGVPNSDFGSGRPSFAQAPNEPASGSFSRSYVEQTYSAQQGDKSSGSKPWETQQYSQQRFGYGSNSQFSDDGSNSEAHQNGKAPAEEPRPMTYGSGIEERQPPQHRWVPPQPPGVVMAEAAAAIRQPKSLPKQPSSDTSEADGEMQLNGAPRSSAVTEVTVNGSGTSDAGQSKIDEPSEAI